MSGDAENNVTMKANLPATAATLSRKIRKMVKLHQKTTLERRLRLMDSSKNGLHEALGLTLICSRIMGLFPVTGLLSSSSELKYTLKSPYTIVYATTLIGQFVLSIMSVYWLVQNKISLPNTTNALFYGSSFITSLILAQMGSVWPQFIAAVVEVESQLPPFARNVKRYCNIFTVIILFLAIVEHIFSLMYGRAIALACNPNDADEMYFLYNMPCIFYYVPYHISIGILFEIFNIQSTFMWSYNDLLIIVVSIYLSENLRLHYKVLKQAVKQDHFSAEMFRVQYLKITKLVKLFNSRFGIYILTSFGFNLYWICTQLFNSLNKKNTGHIIAFDCNSEVMNNTLHGMEHTIYFSFSFSFLVARTLLVLLTAAKVNHTSSAPLMLLYEIPPAKYDVEVERFVDQINNMKVSMSGLGFFHVTRTMILTLIGSIITYELVLLQFNK